MNGDASGDHALPQPLTEPDSIDGCSEARFEDWYRDHYERLRSLCSRILSDATAAEDMAQEALLRAWLGRERMREQDVGAWLSVVARNLCISHMRKSWRAVPHDVLPETADLDADPARVAEISETRRSVRRALSQVGDRHRRLLVRREVGGADYAELGDELGLTPSGARAVLFRARRSLKERLAAVGEGLGAWVAGVKGRIGNASHRVRDALQPLETGGVHALQAGLTVALASGLALTAGLSATQGDRVQLSSAARSESAKVVSFVDEGSGQAGNAHEVREAGSGGSGRTSRAVSSAYDRDDGSTTITIDPPGKAPPKKLRQYEEDGKNPYSFTDIWLDFAQEVACKVDPGCDIT